MKREINLRYAGPIQDGSTLATDTWNIIEWLLNTNILNHFLHTLIQIYKTNKVIRINRIRYNIYTPETSATASAMTTSRETA